ncbi:Protein C04F6.7 [Aphelenchoides avenae]|nr:Protein C04F6.7 [Aphelenchus avenae]
MVDLRSILTDPSISGEELVDRHLTTGFVLRILLAKNAEFSATARGSRITKVYAKGIGECKGFASVVYRCTVEFESAEEEPYTFMMKVPTTLFFKEFLFTDKDGELTADPICAIMDGHNGECAFYEHFAAAGVVPTPRVWYTREMTGESGVTGVIIMEDLSRHGCSPSLATSASIHQRLPVGNFYHVEQWEADLFWRSIDELFEYDKTLKPLVDKFKPFATPEFARYALLDRPKELGLPAALCHGDLWVNNLMFKRAPDGTASNDILAFLDWQNVFYGNPMFDLARYLAFCADAEVRREVEAFIFDYYLNELSRRMALKNRKPDFGTSHLKKAYLLAQIQQTTEAIPMVPFANNLVSTDNEAVQKAVKAKLALRSRLLMEDAIEAMEAVAKDFLSKKA